MLQENALKIKYRETVVKTPHPGSLERVRRAGVAGLVILPGRRSTKARGCRCRPGLFLLHLSPRNHPLLGFGPPPRLKGEAGNTEYAGVFRCNMVKPTINKDLSFNIIS